MAESQAEPQAFTCHWHPETATRLSCSQCRRHICTVCLVQAPVGIRCRECGRAQPLPTFDVRPVNYARAVAVAAGVFVLGTLVWFVLDLINNGWLASLIMPPVIGYATGYLVSRAVNLKRSRGLMLIAGGTVVLASLVGVTLTGILGLWGLMSVAVGVLIAIGRVRL